MGGTKPQQQNKRVALAYAEAAKAQADLRKQLAERGRVDSEVMRKSQMALRVQALSAEFGRLQEEHRQLAIEKQALARSGLTVVPSVKGNVKKI